MKLAVPAAVAVPAALVLFVGVGLGGHAGGAAIAPGQPSGTSLPGQDALETTGIGFRRRLQC